MPDDLGDNGHIQRIVELSKSEHVRRIVDAAPPLTQEQADRIAVLLSYHCETQITGDELQRARADHGE